jgi:GxxExxY protein
MNDDSFKQYKDIVYKIIGAAMRVHSELRWGLQEAVYNESLRLELIDNGMEAKSEEPILCHYKSHLLEKQYKMDLVVGDVIVELKSVQDIVPAHRAQLFNYLRLTHRPVGILINFGSTLLQGERYGYIEKTNECVLLDKNMNVLKEKIDWSSDESQ